MQINTMQRSSSTMSRNILIGSMCVIALLTVLYYLKRVEVGHIKHDMDDLVLQRSDREDELNRKLTEYLQKLEDMTRQLGDINSRLQECEDNKATVVMEIQKCKSDHTECLNTKDGAAAGMQAAQAELSSIKGQQDGLSAQLAEAQRNQANVQRSLADAERELQQSEDDREACTASLRDANGQVRDCQQREQACQASLGSNRAQPLPPQQQPSNLNRWPQQPGVRPVEMQSRLPGVQPPLPLNPNHPLPGPGRLPPNPLEGHEQGELEVEGKDQDVVLDEFAVDGDEEEVKEVVAGDGEIEGENDEEIVADEEVNGDVEQNGEDRVAEDDEVILGNIPDDNDNQL